MSSSTDSGAGANANSSHLCESLAKLELARGRVYYDARADQGAIDAYYRGLDATADPQALFKALSQLIGTTHAPRLGYDPMSFVYPWVDLHPDGRLRSIYSGLPADPEAYILADAEIERARAARLQQLRTSETTRPAAELRLILEDELPYNCEHVVPQSWFDERAPMRGDLHHLFACEARCNSFRGNLPYYDFADEQVGVDNDCGRQGPEGFEPVAGKGPIARASLYFLLRYPGEIGDEARELHADRLPTLLKWSLDDPVEDYERHRNMAVAELQGNRNPLIDHAEWASRIDFGAGFG